MSPLNFDPFAASVQSTVSLIDGVDVASNVLLHCFVSFLYRCFLYFSFLLISHDTNGYEDDAIYLINYLISQPNILCLFVFRVNLTSRPCILFLANKPYLHVGTLYEFSFQQLCVFGRYWIISFSVIPVAC